MGRGRKTVPGDPWSLYQTQSIPRKAEPPPDTQSDEPCDAQLSTSSDAPATPPTETTEAIAPATTPWTNHAEELNDDFDAKTTVSLASVDTRAVPCFPSTHAWQRMSERSISVQELQKARKYGRRTPAGKGCVFYELEGVVVLTKRDRKTCITCWHSHLQPTCMHVHKEVRVRPVKCREDRIIGADGCFAKAIQAQYGVELVVLASGHVQRTACLVSCVG